MRESGTAHPHVDHIGRTHATGSAKSHPVV